jgi:hypothetical protein
MRKNGDHHRMAMPRTITAISGELLFRQLRVTNESELSYLIVKHGLTVFEPLEEEYAKKHSRHPKFIRTDPEELLQIVQYDPGALRSLLFSVSEIGKVCPPETELHSAASLITEVPAPKPGAQSYRGFVAFDAAPTAKKWRGKEYYAYDTKASLKRIIEQHENQIQQSPNVFSLLGEVWFVKFKDEEWGLYPNHQKYRYIAILLSLCDGNDRSHASEFPIDNVELYDQVRGRATTDSQVDDEVIRELNESDFRDNLSVEDLRRLEKIGYDLLEKLREAKDSGNKNRIKKAEKEIDQYRSYLSKDYGILALISKDGENISFRKYYRPNQENEGLRQIIKNQIRNAERGFRRMPGFKSHLEHSLQTGSHKTVYTPENPIAWTVTL